MREPAMKSHYGNGALNDRASDCCIIGRRLFPASMTLGTASLRPSECKAEICKNDV